MSSQTRAASLGAGLLVLGWAALAARPAPAAVAFDEPEALPLALGDAYGGMHGIVKADLDGDGRLDVAVSGYGRLAALGAEPRDFVAALLGDGDGGFQAPVPVDLGPAEALLPGDLVAADLDEDGATDLVVVAQTTRQLVVLLGRGDGTFVRGGSFDAGTRGLLSATAADLDRDGHVDLAAADFTLDVPGQVAVLRGDGAGGLGAPALYAAGRLVHGLAAADLDGKDGPDLVAISHQDQTIDVLLNDGAGGFPAAATPSSVRTNGTGFFLADHDGDEALDALVCGRGGIHDGLCGLGCLVLLHGNGDGTFTPPPPEDVLPAEGWLQHLFGEESAPDLDGDGRPDAMFTHIGALDVVTTVVSGGGERTVADWVASPGPGRAPAWWEPVEGNDTYGVVAGDFDGDGAQDLVVTAAPVSVARPGGLSLLRGSTSRPGTFHAPRLFPSRGWASQAARGLALGAVDGAAGDDLALLASTVDLLPGLGSGVLGPPATALGAWASTFVNVLRLGDLDRDGALDAVWLGTDGVQGGSPPLHFVALGAGDGTFAPHLALAPRADGYAGRDARLADLDGDGDLDLAVLTSWTGSVVPAVRTQLEAWRNDLATGGGFSPADAFDLQASGLYFAASIALAAADLDGDGAMDLAAHRSLEAGGDELVVFDGRGDGTFEAGRAVSYDLGLLLADLLAGDLDGDGAMDLIAVGGGGAWVLRGAGGGAFHPRVAYQEACNGPREARLLDLDGDGAQDLALACASGLAVLPGNGEGTFGAPRRFAMGVAEALALAAGDLDGRGGPDLVVGHPTAWYRHFTVLLDASGPRADLELALERTPAVAHAGERVIYTATCANAGPEPASAVRLRSPLRQGAAFLSAAASQGSCTAAAGAVTCDLGALAPGASATVTLQLRPAAPGTLWHGASARSPVVDPDTADNAAAVATEVLAAAADVALTLAGAPDPVELGGTVTYTATVRNDGPSPATEVETVVALPAGVVYLSAVAGQGSCAASSGTVACSLGALEAGASTTVAIVVRPEAAGRLSCSATAGAAEADPDPADGMAAVETTVNAPAETPGGDGGGCGCRTGSPSGAWQALLAVLLLAPRPRRSRPFGTDGQQPFPFPSIH